MRSSVGLLFVCDWVPERRGIPYEDYHSPLTVIFLSDYSPDRNCRGEGLIARGGGGRQILENGKLGVIMNGGGDGKRREKSRILAKNNMN